MIPKKITIGIVATLLSVLNIVSAQNSVTTLILVRHAEKQSDGTTDPDLTDVGRNRAKLLADMLSNTDLTAIYSTNYKRTRNTIAPTASAHDLKIQSYKAFDENSLQDILSNNSGGTVLVVGHSNNIPWIANVLTGTKDFSDWKEDDYDNLLIVTVGEDKIAKVTKLRFGQCPDQDN